MGVCPLSGRAKRTNREAIIEAGTEERYFFIAALRT
jgi:hypothetical protein